MPITLQHVPLSADDRHNLARILESWPKQPVLVIGETWIEGSQVFNQKSAKAYFQLLYDALTEVMRIAGVITHGQPVSYEETGGPAPYDHLSKTDRMFLGQVSTRLGHVAMLTRDGLIYKVLNPVMAIPFISLLGRGLDGTARLMEAGQTIQPPRKWRV